MREVIADFFQLGFLRIIAKVIIGIRAFVIIANLSPMEFGQYTIWMLYVFYLFMLECGVLIALERDIPHFRGDQDVEALMQVKRFGWSLYFIISGFASLSLGLLVFFLHGDTAIAVLLGLHLGMDKLYRAYYANARILYKYREIGIADLIFASTSLLLVWFLVPAMGIKGIFLSLVVAAFVGVGYLKWQTVLGFEWVFNFKKFVDYVKTSIPLAMIVYSIEIFHAAAMTILAIRYDKATLGYYAFAYKIFYICLQLLPSLMNEVIRTRMYFKIATQKEDEEGFHALLYPITVYCFLAAAFWMVVYWWADWGIQKFFPEYVSAVITLKILTLTLLPLGVARICSDYLCSRAHQKTVYVIKVWFSCILMQGILLFVFNMSPQQILTTVPAIYLLATMIVYFLVVGQAFNMKSHWKLSLAKLISLLMPILAVGILVAISALSGMRPQVTIENNIAPFLSGAGLSLLIFMWMAWRMYKLKDVNLFLRRNP